MTTIHPHRHLLAADGIDAAERGAERLLARHGVRVTRWHHGDPAREIQARAEVARSR